MTEFLAARFSYTGPGIAIRETISAIKIVSPRIHVPSQSLPTTRAYLYFNHKSARGESFGDMKWLVCWFHGLSPGRLHDR